MGKLGGMIELNPDESRVLGVLIEKALTTPDQYPLSLNAVTNGANQKNNRDPVIAMSEDQAHDALEGLRGKGLVVRVDTPGNRVPKFKHSAGETLHARIGELAILAELLLRGPQTLGELRGRAARMHPMESLESARELLRALMERDEPLARELPPAPGTRAEKYTQLLCPDAHPNAAIVASAGEAAPSGSLANRVATLETELESLKSQVHKLCEALGQPVP
jgi:uncharacterized protein YceH (UPF0502 family)